MGIHMVLDISITHPCVDGNQPWVRQITADARHASKHQRLRENLPLVKLSVRRTEGPEN
jgi:hypothetical protein